MKLQAHPSPKSPRGYDDDFLREKTGTNKYYKRINPATGRPYHAGIDLPPSRYRVDGDPVCAPWDGTVRLESFGVAYGRQVTVVADDGYGAFMAHLSAIYVSEGQRVKAGQHIADMGNTGSQSVGTHLHFEKRRRWDDWNSVENPYQELRALEAGGQPSNGEDEDMTEDEHNTLKNTAEFAETAVQDLDGVKKDLVKLKEQTGSLIKWAEPTQQNVENMKKDVIEIKVAVGKLQQSGGGQIDIDALAEAILDKQAERLKA